jgi:hypothetical protein
MTSVVVVPTTNTVEIGDTVQTTVSVAVNQLELVAVAQQGPRGVAGDSADLSNVSVIAGDGLSGGGALSSNVALQLDATVVRTSGDQVIDGNKSFGSTLFIDSANSRIGINSSNPRIDLQIGDVGLGTFTITTSSTIPNQIADAWDASTFRSAKYQIQIYSNTASQYEVSEIFLMHDDVNVYITEYAIINQGERLISFDASLNNSTVRLLCDPVYAVNQIKVFRTMLST